MPELDALAAKVLLAAFFLGFAFGAIAQRTHFCTMGAIGDVVNLGDATRLRQWVLAGGVAMIGFWMLAAAGQVDPGKTLYSGNRWLWLSATAGGLMFGFGMVLASGCGSKTLVRIGSGNLKSVVVFVVLGISAFATLKGITAVARVATVDRIAVEFAQPALLPASVAATTGLSMAAAGLICALLVGGAMVAWALLGRGFRTFDNLLAGLGIGAVVAVAWWVSGHMGYVAEHPETLQEAFVATNSGRSEALSFVAPVAYTLDWLMFFSDRSKLLTVGIVSVVGVIAGSAAAALLGRTFRWEGFGGTEDVANHLAGGVLMGVGGVTAMGCTIGQGLSGLSTLSATSVTAVAAIVAGAVGGFKYQLWRLEGAP
ncbi:YeeE/YedE family protein [Caenimonas sedimenti]|uniref:YeeE/YedE family protein n=1 Tax=Caenimonas sedimenti TaxID=2596921 RepID=A0A562ZN59_9BURK|nr:YeeE/YedE family protein [Caenimonas sedimenti]TWO70019.1 YeeE/YedE family protein [Caenimonas sedimenti]